MLQRAGDRSLNPVSLIEDRYDNVDGRSPRVARRLWCHATILEAIRIDIAMIVS